MHLCAIWEKAAYIKITKLTMILSSPRTPEVDNFHCTGSCDLSTRTKSLRMGLDEAAVTWMDTWLGLLPESPLWADSGELTECTSSTCVSL